MRYGVVLGRAAGVWDELAAVKRLINYQPITVIAVKRAGRDYDGPVHHWPMFHHDLFPKWIAERAAHGRPPAENYWASRTKVMSKNPPSAVPLRWLPNIGGSSGLLGVQVALQDELALDKIILCGIPMDKSARYDNDAIWKEALAYRKAWEQFKPQMIGKVRSMSGWTQTLLGPVTKEWLNETPQQADTGGATQA